MNKPPIAHDHLAGCPKFFFRLTPQNQCKQGAAPSTWTFLETAETSKSLRRLKAAAALPPSLTPQKGNLDY